MEKIYKIVSYVLLMLQLLFLFILFYNKVRLGRILYFGNTEDGDFSSVKYFMTLQLLLYSTFGLLFLWCILTPFAVISNRNFYRNKIDVIPGLIGFLIAVILLFTDPFGIFKWFTG